MMFFCTLRVTHQQHNVGYSNNMPKDLCDYILSTIRYTNCKFSIFSMENIFHMYVYRVLLKTYLSTSYTQQKPSHLD